MTRGLLLQLSFPLHQEQKYQDIHPTVESEQNIIVSKNAAD